MIKKENKKINWIMFFPLAKNIHIVKSNGMIPFSLELTGDYSCKFVCYKNDSYKYSEIYNDLNIDFIDKKYNNILDSFKYIFKNYKDIDVLHLYHMSQESFYIALFYKILRRGGLVYLKADVSNQDFFDRGLIKSKIKRIFCKIFDVISCESKEVCDLINKKYNYSMVYMPNGFFEYNYDVDKVSYKEKTILFVGRVGIREKANHILIESFIKILNQNNTWKLKLVGPLTEEFKEYLKVKIIENKISKSKIEVVGSITNREKLNQEYEKAAIFALSSISEGFPTVFLEAMKSGCYLVSSNLPISKEVIKDEKIGLISKKITINEYSKALQKAINKFENGEINQFLIRNYVYNNFYWPNNINIIDKKIKTKLNKEGV